MYIALCRSAVLLVSTVFAAGIRAQDAGRIVVSSDEWFLSNTGFSAQPASTLAFVTNLTEWFGGPQAGDYLAYSSNFSLTGTSLGNAMQGLGHSWTVSRSISFDLQTLLDHDGIFLASGGVPDLDLLADYVRAGGNVLLLAGTSSNSAATAAYWNPFLDHFGLALDPALDGLCLGCSLGVTSSHPLLDGVSALYHDRGQDALDVAPSDPRSQVIAFAGGHERFAVFDGTVDATPPMLACPPGITRFDSKGGPPGEVVTFVVTAVDDEDPAPSVVCSPTPGSFFPRGITVVTCTATDAAGNQSTCTFPVLVMPTVWPR